MLDFGDALAGYLFNRQLKVTSYDIANLVTGATSEEVSSPSHDVSLIDRLIQEELDVSVGLQGEAKGAQGSGAGRISEPGGMELGGELEDPASWFSDSEAPAATATTGSAELDSGEHASGSWRESGLVGLDGSKPRSAPAAGAKSGKSSKGPLPPAPRRKDGPAVNPAEPVSLVEPVRASAADDERDEDAAPAPVARPAQRAAASKARPKSTPAAEPPPEAAPASTPAPAVAPASSGGGAGKYVAIGLVVAAVLGAAAFWFTTRM